MTWNDAVGCPVWSTCHIDATDHQAGRVRRREFTSPPDPLPRRGKLLLGDLSAETPASGTSGPRRGTHACGAVSRLTPATRRSTARRQRELSHRTWRLLGSGSQALGNDGCRPASARSRRRLKPKAGSLKPVESLIPDAVGPRVNCRHVAAGACFPARGTGAPSETPGRQNPMTNL